jgi:hypothetical protein
VKSHQDATFTLFRSVQEPLRSVQEPLRSVQEPLRSGPGEP